MILPRRRMPARASDNGYAGGGAAAGDAAVAAGGRVAMAAGGGVAMAVGNTAVVETGAATGSSQTGEATLAFVKSLWEENPVFRALLGMCPTLAVTAACKPALTMGLAATFVLLCSNVLVSIMRKALTPHLRILMFTLTISVFVTIADLFLKAFMPDMSEVLGPFVPLIIVNCMIIARAESCASKKPPFVAFMDGLGTGLGFTLALLMLATIREILGGGTWFEIQVLPDWWIPWTVMKLPAGAFITLGFMLAVIIHIHRRKRKTS